jgi:hypothetical protein
MAQGCDNWLRGLKQPCGDCHDKTNDCVWCEDCNPQTFIVRLKNFQLHTSCMEFGSGVEKVNSYSLEGDFTLRRATDDLSRNAFGLFSDISDDDVPICRWVSSFSIDAEYVKDAVRPDDDGGKLVYYGDVCECMKGEIAKPSRAYIELVIAGKPAGRCHTTPDVTSHIRIAYEYESDLSGDDGNLRDNPLRVVIFEAPIKAGPECFTGGHIHETNYLNWVTQSDGTEERFGAPIDGNRFCRGDIFWKACNRDYFDASPLPDSLAREFNGGGDSGSWSSEEPTRLLRGVGASKNGCKGCKRVGVRMKPATEYAGFRSMLFSTRKPAALILNYPDVWRQKDAQRTLFFNRLDETRFVERLSRLHDAKGDGHHNDYLESVEARDVSLMGYNNLLVEQPGYRDGQQIMLDGAMVAKGLMDPSVHKTVPLTVTSIDGGPRLVLKGAKNTFIKQLVLTTGGETTGTSLPHASVHLRFRYDYIACEEQRAYFHKEGPREQVIDNVPCYANGDKLVLTVNALATDFIEVQSDHLSTGTVTAAQAVVMEPKDYLKSVVNADDFSACFDGQGRCIVFYTDRQYRLGRGQWSSSSSNNESSDTSDEGSFSFSSLSSSSAANDCGERGPCLVREREQSESSQGECFTGETLIKLADGRDMRLEHIDRSTQTLSFDDGGQFMPAKVSSVIEHVVPNHIRLVTQRGMVNVTAMHPFYVGDGEFRPAHTLQPGDILQHYSPTGLVLNRVIQRQFVPRPVTVFNLNIEFPDTFFANGMAVHNKDGGARRTADPDSEAASSLEPRSSWATACPHRLKPSNRGTWSCPSTLTINWSPAPSLTCSSGRSRKRSGSNWKTGPS